MRVVVVEGSDWAASINVSLSEDHSKKPIIAGGSSDAHGNYKESISGATTDSSGFDIGLADTKVFGLPRPVFVIITGTVIMSLLIGSLCIYNLIASHRYYRYNGFQKVSSMGHGATLFHDDEEEADELSRKSQFNTVKHYQDDPNQADDDLGLTSEDELYNVKVWSDKPPVKSS